MGVSVNARLTGTQNIDEPSSKGYGATTLSSDATNKTALQDAIAAVDINGGGAVINQHDIDYGFRLTDPATYPDFSGTTTDMVVLDYGPGLADPAGNKQGAQIRYFFNTKPVATAITFTAGLASAATSGTLTGNWTSATGPYAVTFSNGDVRNVTLTLNATSATWATGLTASATANATHPEHYDNGNTRAILANWHPADFIFNTSNLAAASDPTRLATDNRRASHIFGNDGYSYWRLGQGTLAGPDYTDEELSNFVLEHYQQTGDTLPDYAPLIIERKTGNWAFGAGANSPEASYHFKSVTTGLPTALFHTPFSTIGLIILRNSVGIGDDVHIRNNAGSFEAFVPGLGAAFSVSKTTRNVQSVTSSTQQSATAPVLATSGTITTTVTGVSRVAPAGAVTAVILQAGLDGGQEVKVINESAAASTITFAVAATSNVADGVSTVIAGLRSAVFVWDSFTALWYRS